jgi:hypothetical protein
MQAKRKGRAGETAGMEKSGTTIQAEVLPAVVVDVVGGAIHVAIVRRAGQGRIKAKTAPFHRPQGMRRPKSPQRIKACPPADAIPHGGEHAEAVLRAAIVRRGC